LGHDRQVLRGVVLAAGASSRMGRPKPALPLGDPGDTFLSRLLRTFQAAGIPEIVVVTGAASDVVRAAAGRHRRAVRFVQHDRWRDGQLSSLLAGLRPRAGEVLEGAVVALVDAPFASVNTVAQVVQTWRRTRAPIVRPARGDVHGHPVVFDAALFPAFANADPHVGAKAVVRSNHDRIVNVLVDDDGAFIDVDTMDEYHEALRHLRR
jgi:molybdenum cofactor cytidylyltransferase